MGVEGSTAIVYTSAVLRNVTLSADPELIDAARKRAETEHSTLNEQFRRWLAEYAGRDDRAELAMDVIEDLRSRMRSGGRRFSRDELNER